MRKIILLLALFGLLSGAYAQDKYISKAGHIWFYSKTPMETIEAHNHQVATVLNIANGTTAFDVLIKSFKFERALMEEHFNENYMEAGKFPKSTFKGKFVDFDVKNFKKDGTYQATVEGDLLMHGVTKHITQKGTLEVKGGKIISKAKFNIKPEEYGIEIPSLVRDKISANMQVTVDITYEPYK